MHRCDIFMVTKLKIRNKQTNKEEKKESVAGQIS